MDSLEKNGAQSQELALTSQAEAEAVIEAFLGGSGSEWVERLRSLPNRVKAEIIASPNGKKLIFVLLFDAALEGGKSGGQLKAFALLLNAGKESAADPSRRRGIRAQVGDQTIEVFAGGASED